MSSVCQVVCLSVRGRTPPPPHPWFLGSLGIFKQLSFSDFFFSKFFFTQNFSGWSKARHNASKHSSLSLILFCCDQMILIQSHREGDKSPIVCVTHLLPVLRTLKQGQMNASLHTKKNPQWTLQNLRAFKVTTKDIAFQIQVFMFILRCLWKGRLARAWWDLCSRLSPPRWSPPSSPVKSQVKMLPQDRSMPHTPWLATPPGIYMPPPRTEMVATKYFFWPLVLYSDWTFLSVKYFNLFFSQDQYHGSTLPAKCCKPYDLCLIRRQAAGMSTVGLWSEAKAKAWSPVTSFLPARSKENHKAVCGVPYLEGTSVTSRLSGVPCV